MCLVAGGEEGGSAGGRRCRGEKVGEMREGAVGGRESRRGVMEGRGFRRGVVRKTYNRRGAMGGRERAKG